MQRTVRVGIYVLVLLAGGVLGYFFSRQEPKQKLLGSAREQIVPAQTLRLIDGHSREFGALALGSDGSVSLELTDADGGVLSQWVALPDANGLNASEMLTIYGGLRSTTGIRGKAFLNVMLYPGRPVFHSYLPDGSDRTVWGKGWHHSTFTALLELARNFVAPPKREYTLEKEVPSEDLRLVTREGWAFAVLGLGEGAEPRLALLRHDGGLFGVLGLTEKGMFPAGEPKEWPMLSLFDKYGRLRVTVEFGPDPHPVLTIYEQSDPSSSDWGIYALDPTASKEIPVQNPFSSTNREGAISWLPQQVSPAPSPITLADQRGSTLWQYRPSVQ